MAVHAPYERIFPGAENAVIFIHGIVSTPRFWDEYIAAIPEDWSVVNLLLPGHGGSVTDFGRAKRGAWRRHVQETIGRLKATHARVFLVGHSMGGLLSILEAVDAPDGIAGLMLMAPALRIRVKPSALWHNTLKGLGLAESREELARYYSVIPDWRFWRYIGWIPRYLELFSLSRQARHALPRLAIPTRAFIHAGDELVSPKIGPLLSANPCVTLQTLPDSMHHSIAPTDAETLRAALRDMCQS